MTTSDYILIETLQYNLACEQKDGAGGDGNAVGAGFTDHVLLMSDSLTRARPPNYQFSLVNMN